MKPNDRTNLQRRRFLGLLGRAGIGAAMCRAAPLVGGLMHLRQAHAAPGSVKRAVFVYTPNGAPNGLWLPEGRTLNLATQGYEGLQSLCNFREVEVVGSGHGLSRKVLGELRWTQDWTSDTLDQQLGAVLGASTPFPSYALGVQTNSTDLIGRRSGSAVPCQTDPSAAYRQLFAGAPPADDAAGHLARQRSIMDINRGALAGLKSRLGSFERQTLEQHEAALQAIERRLAEASTAPPNEACTSPSWNADGHPTSGAESVPFMHTAQLHADLITAAFQCGVTNVMTLQLGWHQGTWYGHDTAFRGDHHNSCHSAGAAENAEMTNYLSRCVAYLVRRLMETEDPLVPGTQLIDNTVVVQVTDMGDGQDHSGGQGPNMVATRMPGFRQGTVTQGGNHFEVLEAVVEGMGLGAHKGTDVDQHRIWPCAGGRFADALLA